jgi:EmrB/QacA subfamily drug resistance transporter
MILDGKRAEEEKTSIVKPLFVIILICAVTQFGNTSFNVLIPVLSDEFSAPISSVQWLIVGYMLMLASVTPFAAWFADRFGGKKVMLSCAALFGAVSAVGAFSPNIQTLAAFRMLQGAVGAMAGPIGMAKAYSLCDKKNAGKIMGLVGIPIFMTPAFGPILSGWLADIGSWKTIMHINLPICAIILVTGLFWLPSGKGKSTAKPDIVGMFCAPAALVGIIYGLQNLGSESGINFMGFLALLIGAIALWLFIKTELAHEKPVLRLTLFKEKGFAGAVVLQALSVLLVPGFLFLLPLFFQRIYGWSAFSSGLIMLPIAAASALGMPVGGKLYDKKGIFFIVAYGFSSAALGILMFCIVSGFISPVMIVCSFCLMGFGLGFYSTSLTTHVLAQAPKELVTNASAINSVCMQVMNAAAISVSSAILSIFTGSGQASSQSAYSCAFIVTFCLAATITVVSAVLARHKTFGR